MKRIKRYLLVFILLFICTNVNAMNVKLTCPSKITAGGDFDVTLTLIRTASEKSVSAMDGTITYDSSKLTIKSSTNLLSGSGWSQISAAPVFAIANTGYDNLITSTSKDVYKVTFTANGSLTGDVSVSVGSLHLTDVNGDMISGVTGGSCSTHVASTVNTLSDLKIDGVTVTGFNKDTTTYNVTTNNSSVAISATKTDNNSTITGVGSKTLSYGSNPFSIKVTSESGSTKTYTLNITRNDTRSTNNYLKSLTIDGMSFSFSKTTLTYNLSTNLDKIVIKATAEDSKSTVTGTGTQTLKTGKNTFKVYVKSEKGETKTYTLNVTKVDTSSNTKNNTSNSTSSTTKTETKSTNNYLKSLTISSGTLKFDKNTSTYNVTVDSSVSTMKVEAILEDSKASFVDGYAPKTINLVSGNNTVTLKIKSESGSIRTYIIYINKDDGRDSNADLEYLKITEGTIEFNKDTIEYKITVLYDVTKITIDAKAVSAKATLKIDNPTTLNVGENTATVKVTAENGAEKEYKIIVIRKEQDTELSSDCDLSNLTIENYTLNFNKDVTSYNLTIKDETSLPVSVTTSDNNATYKITGNDNLVNGSVITITVFSESGTSKDYKINIIKEESGFKFNTMYIVVGGLVVILIVLIILIIMKKKKQGDSLNTDDQSSINSLNNGVNINTNNVNNNVTPNANINQNITPLNNSINSNVVNNMEINPNPTNVNVVDNNAMVNSNINVNNMSQNNNANMEQNINPNANMNINQNVNSTPNMNFNNNVAVEQFKSVNRNTGNNLTKVCSNCGRRVPYEAGTCPYCMNNF